MGQDPRNGSDDLDLARFPPVTAYPAQRDQPPLPTSPVDRRLWMQEVIRASLAIFLGLLFFLVIILAFVSTRPFDQIRELLEIFVPVIVTLLGTVTTFYYIDRKRD